MEYADNSGTRASCLAQKRGYSFQVGMVERAGRLVKQEQARSHDECTGDVDTLLLATREQGGIRIVQFGRQHEPGKHGRGAFARFFDG